MEAFREGLFSCCRMIYELFSIDFIFFFFQISEKIGSLQGVIEETCGEYYRQDTGKRWHGIAGCTPDKAKDDTDDDCDTADFCIVISVVFHSKVLLI